MKHAASFVASLPDRYCISVDDIDAECWVGNPDERSVYSDDQKALMGKNFDVTQSDPYPDKVWMLGQMEIAPGVNETRYSCIYSLYNDVDHDSEESVYEGSDDRPFRTKTVWKNIDASNLPEPGNEPNLHSDPSDLFIQGVTPSPWPSGNFPDGTEYEEDPLIDFSPPYY